MPNGFPAFRHDPTTAPRYIIRDGQKTSDTASTSTDSTQQSTETAKTSKDQYPSEQDPSKKPQSKLKGKLEKLFG